MNAEDPETMPVAEPTRPVAITVICFLGFFGALVTIPGIFSELARQVGIWYPPYLAVSVAVGLVCMTGFWKMRKWAVYAYGGFYVLNQLMLLSMGVWNPIAILVPGLVLAITFGYLARMR